MNGKQWIKSFMISLNEFEKESYTKTDIEWTRFIGKVIEGVGTQTNCYVAMRRPKLDQAEYSGEYLNIDALFFDLSAYDDWETNDWDPPVLPSAAVELENDYSHWKITYCLWKILCIRSLVRVLICYQAKSNDILLLKSHLEAVILQRRLMEGDRGDLLIIVGDDSRGNESEWKDYFYIFEWHDDKLKRFPASAL